MKRILLLAALFFSIGSGFAQSLSSGFYRIQNQYTGRYMKVRDNYGYLDMKQSDPDLTAITTIYGVENAIVDPGTVMYIQPVGEQYNVIAQGTDMHSIIGYYIRFMATNNGTTWRAYQSKSGATKYISDEYDCPADEKYSSLNTSTSKSRDWYVTPIDASTDTYSAVKPTIQVENKYYAAYFAGYAFDLVSEGMKAYYIDLVQDGYCRLAEITGTVPAATPVIIECSSNNPYNNKIQPVSSSVTSVKGNKLTGVYFDIDENDSHRRYVTYNANTMRVLGLTSDGKLGLVTNSSLSHVPENTFYMTVASGTAASLEVVEEIPAAKIVVGDADGDGKVSVSDITKVASMIIEGITGSSANPAADVDGDGKVSVSDITALAAKILEQSQSN
jgi:hypothetical protein